MIWIFRRQRPHDLLVDLFDGFHRAIALALSQGSLIGFNGRDDHRMLEQLRRLAAVAGRIGFPRGAAQSSQRKKLARMSYADAQFGLPMLTVIPPVAWENSQCPTMTRVFCLYMPAWSAPPVWDVGLHGTVRTENERFLKGAKEGDLPF